MPTSIEEGTYQPSVFIFAIGIFSIAFYFEWVKIGEELSPKGGGLMSTGSPILLLTDDSVPLENNHKKHLWRNKQWKKII